MQYSLVNDINWISLQRTAEEFSYTVDVNGVHIGGEGTRGDIKRFDVKEE